MQVNVAAAEELLRKSQADVVEIGVAKGELAQQLAGKDETLEALQSQLGVLQAQVREKTVASAFDSN